MLKTVWQRSGPKVILAGLLGWVIASLPSWAGLLDLGETWNPILAQAVGVLVAILRMLQLQANEPSIDARTLPESQMAFLPPEQRALVAQARLRLDRRKAA